MKNEPFTLIESPEAIPSSEDNGEALLRLVSHNRVLYEALAICTLNPESQKVFSDCLAELKVPNALDERAIHAAWQTHLNDKDTLSQEWQHIGEQRTRKIRHMILRVVDVVGREKITEAILMIIRIARIMKVTP